MKQRLDIVGYLGFDEVPDDIQDKYKNRDNPDYPQKLIVLWVDAYEVQKSIDDEVYLFVEPEDYHEYGCDGQNPKESLEGSIFETLREG